MGKTEGSGELEAATEPLPRWGFGVGALVGFVFAVPATALTVYVLARLGLGNPQRSLAEALRFATLFAGLPAVLSAGGTARVALRAAAAHAGAAPNTRLLASVRASSITFAPAGMGLVLLCAVPMGELPDRTWPFLGFALAGAFTGAVTGAVIGLWAGSR